VGANFRNLVPIYIELTDGKVIRLGQVRVLGDSAVEQTVPVPKFASPIKKVSINYYYDVLCMEN